MTWFLASINKQIINHLKPKMNSEQRALRKKEGRKKKGTIAILHILTNERVGSPFLGQNMLFYQLFLFCNILMVNSLENKLNT